MRGAHKLCLVGEPEQGYSCFVFEGRWCAYRSCYFGCKWAAFWFARVGAWLVRQLHRFIWIKHGLFLYVDDGLAMLPADVAPLVAATSISVLCKGACSAKSSAKKRALQRSVLCKEACSAKKRAVQRRVLCKEACSAKKRALQKSVLCKEACSAKKRALQRRVLCRGACSAKKRALERSVLCKEACSAKKRALQRRVLCKEACCAEESALQRSVLCKEACMFLCALGVPLSWEKVRLGVEVTWIGWQFSLSKGMALCPCRNVKLKSFCPCLQNCARTKHVWNGPWLSK